MAEKSSENIGDELLRDEEDNFDHISPSHASDDDVICVEETADLRQKPVKQKTVPTMMTSFFKRAPKQSKTSSDEQPSSNPVKFNVGGAQRVWTDPIMQNDHRIKKTKEKGELSKPLSYRHE